MMRYSDFSRDLTLFLKDYLPEQRNVSPNTISSYSVALKQLLEFAKFQKGIEPAKFDFQHMNENFVLEYLNWIEKSRKCSISTRNQRLAAIHSFIKFSDHEHPDNLHEFVKILHIPYKRTSERKVQYLSTDDMALILNQPSTKTPQGRQHRAILCLLYDSAGRAQEIVDLKVRNFFPIQGKVLLVGKGRKSREIPLTSNTVEILRAHLRERNLLDTSKRDSPLFVNHQHNRLTRAGIAYILNKYTSQAREYSSTIPERITPHVLRHTKAMHLLQSGVPIHVIQDILGHSDIMTTERYAHADLSMKQKALEAAKLLKAPPVTEMEQFDEPDLIEWLNAYARECTGKII